MNLQRVVCLLSAFFATEGFAMTAPTGSPVLEGTWVMTSAYEILADGTRTTNYGEHPNGLLMIDKTGRYSLQIFRPDRPKFVSGVKADGTASEYREAVLGSACPALDSPASRGFLPRSFVRGRNQCPA
jgi:hypothetical protein